MRLLDRLRMIVRPSVPVRPERPVEPGEPGAAVEAEYQQRLLELERVRRSIADLMATRRRLEAQADEVRRSVDRLHEQAAMAAAKDQDGLARSALREALDAERRLAKRQATIDGLRRQEQELIEASARLQVRLEDYRNRLEEARARSRS
jgi:phage shock protein A